MKDQYDTPKRYCFYSKECQFLLLIIFECIYNCPSVLLVVNGHEWNRIDLEQIGALIETPPLYENLSAVENLEVRAKLLNIPKIRIDEVLKIVDLQNTGRSYQRNSVM